MEKQINMLEQLVGDSQALDRALAGEELSYKDGLELMNYDNLHLLGAVADNARKKLVNDTVTFAASCQMCAFYRKEGADDAYTLTPQEIEQRVGIAKQMGATEVHIVGGFHPTLPLEYYEDMMRAIKKSHPQLNIKALTAAEIYFLSKLTKNSTKEILSRLKDAGLDSMPGGGAELFHPDIRGKIVRGKCTGQQWLDVIEEAHNMDIKSNVTMLYGHIEKPEHPLKFSLDNTELEQQHLVNNECSSVYDLRIVALSRLMLANVLNNISVYWVAYGKKLAQVALSNGGNDLVGTAFSEEIYKAAGKTTSSSVDELATMVKEIGRSPAQRNTHFDILKKF
jgi:aminodeoxyfutalosine synthase